MKKKQVKSLTDRALEFFCELVVFIFTLTVELLTWVARKFWKRYFGIETPLYKIWWKRRSARNQKRIYIEHPEWQPATV